MQLISDTIADHPCFEGDATFTSISTIVGAIGKDSFAETLLQVFNGEFGIDNCSIYKMSGYKLVQISSASLAGADGLRDNLNVYEVKKQLMQVGSHEARVDVQSIAIAGQPSHPQRIFITAQRGREQYCLGMLRSAARCPMAVDKIRQLRDFANFLLTVVARHVELVSDKLNPTPVLNSLSEIQHCLTTQTELSKREAEVCSRILYGMSSYGIASDLGIGKESVMTYRKRAYQRMGIATQRELLVWYLAQKAGSDVGSIPQQSAAN